MSEGEAARPPNPGAGVALLCATIFYAYVGLMAISQSLVQAVFVGLAVVGLAAGTVRLFMGKPAALVVLLGTTPLFLLSVWATFAERVAQYRADRRSPCCPIKPSVLSWRSSFVSVASRLSMPSALA